MFVYIEYESNLQTAVVEHTQINPVDLKKEPFDPVDTDDFDPRKTYRVHSCDGDNMGCEYLNVKIIRMTETLEEMVLFRAKRPRRSGTHEDDDLQRPKEKACQPPARKDRDHAQWMRRQRLIECALQDYEREPAPVMSVLTDLESRLQAVEKQLGKEKHHNQSQGLHSDTATNGGSIPRSAYMALKNKYESLQQDIEKLRSHNLDLKKSLMLEISQQCKRSLIGTTMNDSRASTPPASTSCAKESNGHMSDTESSTEAGVSSEGDESPVATTRSGTTEYISLASPSDAQQPNAEPDLDETPNTSRPESMNMSFDNADEGTLEIGAAGKDGKLYAGCGFWFTKEEWGKLFSARTDGAFCSRAASLFWTEKELRERSVTGRLSNSAVARGQIEHRAPLSPEKLSALKDLFQVYMGEDTFAARRLKNMRSHLASYLCTLRRKPPTCS